MKLTPKYARHIYRDATMLLRPKTQLKDMTVEVNPGTPAAGADERRHDAALADGPERQLRRIPRRPRRRNARLPAGAAGRRRRRASRTTARPLSATFKRFDPTARDSAGDRHSSCEARHANIARSIHNFRLLMEALGRQGHSSSPSSSTPPTPCSQTFAKEDTERPEARCTCCPARCARPSKGLGKLADGRATWSARRCTSCSPFANALAPAQEATTAACRSRPRRSSRTRSGRSRARSCRSVNELEPDHQGTRAKRSRSWRASFTVLNEFFNELAYNPGPSRAASCSSSPGPTTTSTAWSAPPTRTARSGARLIYFNCKVAADPERRRGGQPDGQAAASAC